MQTQPVVHTTRNPAARVDRVRWTVSPTSREQLREDPGLLPWTVRRNGEVMGTFATQAQAVTYAVTVCRSALKTAGTLSSLRIHRARTSAQGRRGAIRDERTYGRDPKRTRG